MTHLLYRGALYREAHSPEEAKGLIDKTCQDVLDLLEGMAVLVRQTQERLVLAVQDPGHDELDVSVVLARLGGGVKQNLLSAQQSLEIAAQFSAMLNKAPVRGEKP